MADIIQFATGNELQQIITESNKMVSGMTTQEAANALKLVGTEGKMVTGPAVLKPNTNVIEFPNSSASEAITEYVNQGGQLSASNSATVSTTTGAANLTVGKTAAGTTTVLGVLTMNLPTVAAAIAPVLGVGVGVGLYELNPDLWEKISRKLLPFCWENTEVAPAVIDESGQVYLSKEMFDAFQEIMQEEGIGAEHFTGPGNVDLGVNGPINCTTIGVGSKVNKSLTVESITASSPVFGTQYDLDDGSNNSDWTAASPTNFSLKLAEYSRPEDVHSYTYNNLTVYHCGTRDLTREKGGLPESAPQSGYNYKEVAWVMVYGTALQKYFPEGLSEWTGNTTSDYTQGAINVVQNKDGLTHPYYPVTIPVGDPGVSNSPAVRPNPTAPVEFPEIGTYIPTVVNPSTYPLEIPIPDETARTSPIESYVPNLNVNLDPNADPSAVPEPAPEPAPDPYPDLKPPSSGGMSPPIVFPLPGDFPSIVPSSGSGLIHVYNPTPEEMISFGNWLWVSYADASLQKIWNNPFDGVISAHELYATPSNDGRDNIRSGFLVCPTTAALVRQRYTTIDCGSMVVPEYYGNYLDYAPYSKAHVYLPFIGIVELDVDDIVGHGVNITYHIDSYNGSCIAQITVAKNDYQNTVYQFSGNCSVEIPLAGGSQAAIKSGMISAAATGISSIVGGLASMLGGNIGGGIGGIAYGIGGAISQAVSQKSSVQHSGTFGASYGAMGIKKPYFIIHRPIQKMVVNYNEDYGFPAHKRVRIGNCKGFLRVREVHAASSTATDEEKARIEELLKEGVFVS